MSKTDQALVLEPSTELMFKGPFTDVVTAELKLFNPTEKRICFKVKTTAPKRYCVRPNSGILETGGSIAVQVMLQPFEYDPSEKNKHKFMVQSMFAPDGKIESQDQLWKDAPPESLMDTKLRCVFEVPKTTQAPVQDNMQDEKAKVLKTDPVTPPKVTSAVSGGDDKKMMEEVRRLQAEVNSLRAENNQLKDEGVRLRKMHVADTSSFPSSPASSAATMASPASTFPPVIYIVAAIIIGLLIGKLIL